MGQCPARLGYAGAVNRPAKSNRRVGPGTLADRRRSSRHWAPGLWTLGLSVRRDSAAPAGQAAQPPSRSWGRNSESGI
ncbi:hypothetical protein MINS_04620 [Mycolicibacterium insubricum]|nr:hypothetical protein MINS_04620 [Mycolicibacterium insubricum]